MVAQSTVWICTSSELFCMMFTKTYRYCILESSLLQCVKFCSCLPSICSNWTTPILLSIWILLLKTMSWTLSWSWRTLGISLRWLRWGVSSGGAARSQGQAEPRGTSRAVLGALGLCWERWRSAGLRTPTGASRAQSRVFAGVWNTLGCVGCSWSPPQKQRVSVWFGGTWVLFARLFYPLCDWWGHLITAQFTVHVASLPLWRHSGNCIDWLCNRDLGLRNCFKYLLFSYVALRNTCIAANQL